MALSSAAVTVATSATALHSGSVNGSCRVLVVNNDASATMYVGGSDVSTTNGVPVTAGKSLSLTLAPGEIAYGVVASSTLNARVITSRP